MPMDRGTNSRKLLLLLLAPGALSSKPELVLIYYQMTQRKVLRDEVGLRVWRLRAQTKKEVCFMVNGLYFPTFRILAGMDV
jgi:hypothetical protein